ncbi:MAG: hypothetical protein AAF726_17765 [Planctomycetota bacterium]
MRLDRFGNDDSNGAGGRTIRATYASLIADCRSAADMTRAELAGRVGVPAQTVALWEDPDYEGVDLSILQRVARATGSELEIRFRAPLRSAPAWRELLTKPKK